MTRGAHSHGGIRTRAGLYLTFCRIRGWFGNGCVLFEAYKLSSGAPPATSEAAFSS
jgi:hypothetical protein